MEMLLGIWNLVIIIFFFPIIGRLFFPWFLISRILRQLSLKIELRFSHRRSERPIYNCDRTLYLTHWYQAGVRQISDFFDSGLGCFLPGFPVISLCKKFNLKCNFSQYHCVLSAVPLNWKKLLQEVLQSQFVVCSNSRCCLYIL